MVLSAFRLAKNTFAWLSAQALARLLALVLAALIARYEGSAGLGRYMLVLSLVDMAGGAADFGLATFLTRAAAQASGPAVQRQLLGHILVLKGALAAACYLGLLLVGLLLPFPVAVKQLLLPGGVLLPLGAVAGAMGALVNARERMEVTGGLQVAVRLATIAVSIPLLLKGFGVAGVLAGSVAVNGLSIPIYLALLQRWQLLPLFQWDIKAWRQYLLEAYPFGLTTGLTALYARLDLVLISLWQGEIAAGWYSAAYKLWEALALAPSSLLFALFPKMSRLATTQAGMVRLAALFRFGGRLLLLGALLVSAGGTVWAEDLISLVYGQTGDLIPTIITFRLLLWAFPAAVITTLCGRVLYAVRQQRQVLRIMLVVGLFNGLLNLAVIPRWSFVGAALVALASEILLAGLTYVRARRALLPARPVPETLITGGYISAQVTVADLDGDGQPEIIAGSDRLYAWRRTGQLLPGFPVRGRNFFASRPAVSDFDGDGCPEIVVGCDDDALYVFDAAGRLLPGWPRSTGGDVYSSPVLADLDMDGRLEVVVGSDDGSVYAWRADGSHLAGWPRPTGGFVSASPILADLDGDGRPEILIGSWDRQLYAWRADGSRLTGWPQPTGHFVWSAAAVGDMDGDGAPEVAAASDRVYIWRADGSPMAGWPRAIGSYSVASPVLADLDGDGGLELILGSERLYAWRAGGDLMPGFPVALATYFWSSPAVGDVDGDGRPEIVIGGWDGRLYVVGATGDIRATFATRSPFFATPTLADLDGDGQPEILIGGWDSRVHIFKPCRAPRPAKFPSGLPETFSPLPAGHFSHVREFTAPFVVFPGFSSSRAVLRYRAHFETDWHPVPLVVHQGCLTGLIQPFLAGTRVRYYAEIRAAGGTRCRVPAAGTFSYTVQADWPARIRRCCSV